MRAKTTSMRYDELESGDFMTIALQPDGNYTMNAIGTELTPYELAYWIKSLSEMYVSNFEPDPEPAPVKGPPPLPKLTKPDRPSNVETLKPTVELPDLGTIDDEDDLPF